MLAFIVEHTVVSGNNNSNNNNNNNDDDDDDDDVFIHPIQYINFEKDQ